MSFFVVGIIHVDVIRHTAAIPAAAIPQGHVLKIECDTV